MSSGSNSKCSVCTTNLMNGCRFGPLLGTDVRVLIAVQLPSSRLSVTASAIDDASADRLRNWLGVSKAVFRDNRRIALLPTPYCLADRPQKAENLPRRACARKWRDDLVRSMRQTALTLAIGLHGKAWHLPHQKEFTLRKAVREWKSIGPNVMVLPHPSPRNNGWFLRNGWFETEVLPEVTRRVQVALQ